MWPPIVLLGTDPLITLSLDSPAIQWLITVAIAGATSVISTITGIKRSTKKNGQIVHDYIRALEDKVKDLETHRIEENTKNIKIEAKLDQANNLIMSQQKKIEELLKKLNEG